jgi:nucleoside 2-deoxyribosyltransferase
MINIYFASSIRGEEFDKELREKWLRELSNIGSVINKTAYNSIPISDDEIFNQDINLIKQSDIMVAEVSSPSHGVGYEICYAESIDIPIICFHLKHIKISAMIQGNTKILKKTY